MAKDADKTFRENKRLMVELKNAIQEDRIFPVFQPISNTQTGEVKKYECLARLRNLDGTIMNPGVFLDIAKKSKRYEEITRIMITKCFEYFEDKEEYEFAINISYEDISNTKTRTLLIDKIKSFPNPKRIVLEILEDEDFVNYAMAIHIENEEDDFLRIIKKLGCKIAIDDFGTGYSNFSRLMQLDLDILKIDGSLIGQMEAGSLAQLIVKQMVTLAQAMQIKTVAEFVSSEEIYNQVRMLGIDFCQGYFIGKPNENILR